MSTKIKRRRRLFALAVCLLAVAALAGLGVLAAHLLGGSRAPSPKRLGQIRAVELDSGWAEWFLQPQDRQAQQAYLTDTLDKAKEMGANTLLLTGRVDREALFRGKKRVEEMPAACKTIQENDKFLSTFDPMEILIDEAADRGMAVALIATDSWATELFDAAELPAWVKSVSKQYDLPVYSPLSKASELGVRTYTCYDPKYPDLLRMDGTPGTLAAAAQTGETKSLVLGTVSELEKDPAQSKILLNFLEDTELPQLLDKPVPQELAIVSPSQGQKLWSDKVWLMGTSVPDGGPVTVNGQPVAYQGDKGVWGILLPLADGDNNFSAVQSDTSHTITVTKPTGGGGGGGANPPQPDDSAAAQWGQKLRITEPLASLLADQNNPDSIQMTVYEGAVAEVAHSFRVTKGNKITHVYQLQNGGFIRAQDCELLPPGTSNAAFSGLEHETQGKDEVLTFRGIGTPLYTHEWEGNELSLYFYSADFTGSLPDDFGFGGASVDVTHAEHGFLLNFHMDDADPLWGYHVEYTSEGGTRVILKHRPKRSDDPAKPLTGVTVLLDPGHGGTDMGAIGAESESFPQEKDMNLAEARAARHRLEQLGATVLMTREDDSFPTLGDRIQMLNRERPDFFISLHHNSGSLTQDLSGVEGTEVYWFYTEGKPLAQNLLDRVSTASGRPAKGNFYNYFYVTRSNLCPAVLLETGFVCGPKDYERGTDTTVLWAEGGAVAQAVLDSIP